MSGPFSYLSISLSDSYQCQRHTLSLYTFILQLSIYINLRDFEVCFHATSSVEATVGCKWTSKNGIAVRNSRRSCRFIGPATSHVWLTDLIEFTTERVSRKVISREERRRPRVDGTLEIRFMFSWCSFCCWLICLLPVEGLFFSVFCYYPKLLFLQMRRAVVASWTSSLPKVDEWPLLL